MFSETTYPDQIEVLNPSLVVQVRLVTDILKDGVVISSNFSRYILEVGADLTGQPDLVVKICSAVWG